MGGKRTNFAFPSLPHSVLPLVCALGKMSERRMLPVDVQHLDWSCEEVPLWKWTIDVVVGGDVVYDPSALPALASAPTLAMPACEVESAEKNMRQRSA
eukprot:1389315-Amphidinium_carterae.2